MNYINNQSFKCLLGPMSKNVIVNDNLFMWEVNKKRHFTVEGSLTDENIKVLKEYAPSGFHYIDNNNLLRLQGSFKVNRTKGKSVVLDISDLSFTGKKNASIRHALNRCKGLFTLETNYRKLSDVKTMINEWSDSYADKYFRNNVGKNYYFYKNNFHAGLISLFVYKEDDLVAFGTLSTPNDGYSSYVLGKALFKRHYGLSEFADVELYKIGKNQGIKYINMGAATKGLIHYKKKFNGTIEDHFDGKIT